MASIQATYDYFTNPVDMVEQIATIHDWSFERSAPDELTLSVAGPAATYATPFGEELTHRGNAMTGTTGPVPDRGAATKVSTPLVRSKKATAR